MPAVRNLRSPYEKIGGVVYFGRMADKIRLHLAGNLPADYQPMLGGGADATAFDGRCCRFLGVAHADLVQEAAKGRDDRALFAWAWEHGAQPDAGQVEAWNAFMTKRGWRDETSANLRETVAAAGLDPEAILTRFDYLEADEERPLRFAAEPPLARAPFPGFVSTRLALRSPYDPVGGIVHFGRLLDKVRLQAEGRLPSEWIAAQGEAGGGYDALTCRFLRVSYAELAAQALRCASDDEALEWAFAQGWKPNAEQILVWNAYLAKRNWRDEYTPRLFYRLQREGLPATAARTMFDFLDLDEGRPLRFAD